MVVYLIFMSFYVVVLMGGFGVGNLDVQFEHKTNTCVLNIFFLTFVCLFLLKSALFYDYMNMFK